MNDELFKFYEFVENSVLSADSYNFPLFFDAAYDSGTKSFYHKKIEELKIFDATWIKTIESYFPSIDKISRNPRSFIKEEEEITEIEKARRVGARSVKHLSSHTHFISDIDKDNNIKPKKIMTVHFEEDFDVYENRFVMTLINKLFFFIRNRYEVIKNNVESFQKEHINFIHNITLGDSLINLNVDMEVKKDLEDKTINQQNRLLMERVEKLNALISGLRNSNFMKMMANSRPVHPPIMKTNVILKNPDYKNAYNLWLFLDRYFSLGFDSNVKETNFTPDEKYLESIKKLSLLNISTLMSLDSLRTEEYNNLPTTSKLKKKTKLIKNDPRDFVPNPDQILMEDYSTNEYYLRKYESLFNDSVEKFLASDYKMTKEEAYKKAFKEATSITNGIYDEVLEIEDDRDVFNKMVTDYSKEYDKRKEVVKHYNNIVDIKSVDLNDSIRKEKRLIKEMMRINYLKEKQILESLEDEKMKSLRKKTDTEILALREDTENLKKELKRLEDLKNFNKEEKEFIKTSKIEETENLKNEVAKLKEESDNNIKEYKAELAKELAIEKENLKAQEAMRLEALKIRIKELERIIEEETEKARQDALAKKEQIRLALEEAKKKLEEEKNAKLKAYKEALEKKRNYQKELEMIAILKVKKYEALEARRNEENN